MKAQQDLRVAKRRLAELRAELTLSALRESRPGTLLHVGTVYFVRAEATGFIKIGFTSKPDATHRVSDLATSAGPLAVVATVRGSRALEVALHAHFAERRVFGEWFAIEESDVHRLMSSLRARPHGNERVDG
jgi:hypothetical protein